MLNWVLAAVVGYLLGSIPVGYLVGKSRGIDVRKFGSGATGGTNVLRTIGPGAAVITGVSDVLKGVLGAYIGFLLAGHGGYAIGGLAAVVGHSYPVWLRFKGGKSVATGGGSVLVFHPLAFLLGALAGIATIIPTRYVSLGSLVGGFVLALTVCLSNAPAADKALAIGAVVVVYVRHWENIKRLAAGTENRFGQKAKPRPEV